MGAAVILSLGFIGYSVFLQSGSEQNVDPSAQIPVQSQYIEPLDFDSPKGVETVPEVDLDTFFNSTEEIEEEVADIQPILNDQGLPNSWIIKVGSFSSAEKSNEVRDELIEQGFKAYVRQIPDSSLHRVLVGPYLGVEQLKTDQADIDRLLNLETALINNDP